MAQEHEAQLIPHSLQQHQPLPHTQIARFVKAHVAPFLHCHHQKEPEDAIQISGHVTAQPQQELVATYGNIVARPFFRYIALGGSRHMTVITRSLFVLVPIALLSWLIWYGTGMREFPAVFAVLEGLALLTRVNWLRLSFLKKSFPDEYSIGIQLASLFVITLFVMQLIPKTLPDNVTGIQVTGIAALIGAYGASSDLLYRFERKESMWHKTAKTAAEGIHWLILGNLLIVGSGLVFPQQ